MRPFLTAVWSDLILVSYAVPESILQPFLPPGLVLDRLNGKAFASIVAFHFSKTRVMGVPVPPLPNLRDFPELNLRFYVREGDRRGVVFVREYVPNKWVALGARVLYNEPYEVAAGTNQVIRVDDSRSVRYNFTVDGRRQTVEATSRGSVNPADPDASSTFFKEQRWGFGKSRSGKLITYQVTHIPWRTYDVDTYAVRIDFDALFGPDWHFLQSRKPDSVIFAEGSSVAVFPKRMG